MKLYRFLRSDVSYTLCQFDKLFGEGSLFFSTFTQKNDPFEGLPQIRRVADRDSEWNAFYPQIISLSMAVDTVCNRMGWGGYSEPIHLLERALARYAPKGDVDLEFFRNKMRSVSFFRRNDNPLYWGYCSGLDGFCVELECEWSQFGNKFSLERPKPIEYSADRPKISEVELLVAACVMEIFDNDRIDLSDHNINASIASSVGLGRIFDIFNRLLLVKSKAWAQEEEWRIYDFCSKRDYRPVPQLTPVTLIFGPNCSRHHIDTLCEKYDGRVNFKEVGISNSKYDLEFRSL